MVELFVLGLTWVQLGCLRGFGLFGVLGRVLVMSGSGKMKLVGKAVHFTILYS